IHPVRHVNPVSSLPPSPYPTSYLAPVTIRAPAMSATLTRTPLKHLTRPGAVPIRCPAMSEKLTRTQIKSLERLGGVNPADASFSRRQFVTQAGGTGLVVGGALAAGPLARDRWGMEGVKPPPAQRL